MVRRIKLLRYVWETGWSGARSMAPWPDGVFAEIFRRANGWSVRDFWSRSAGVELEFDLAAWGILYGQSQAVLKDDREAILGACLWQARVDGLAMSGYDHVIAFVHEPPANSGTVGGNAVLDQGVVMVERYYREVGLLLGIDRDVCCANASPEIPLLPGVELWCCPECSVRMPRRRS